MHKKAIALLSAALVLASMFAACEKHSRYGRLIVDSRGMEHVIMTDKDGVTVCDENGNLVEILTDSSGKPIPLEAVDGVEPSEGEYQTHPVTFPNLIKDGQKVEDAFCEVTVPDGWSCKGTSALVFTHDATGAQVDVSTDVGMNASELLESTQEDCKKLGVTCTEGVDKLGGMTAQTLDYNVDGLLFRLYVVIPTDERITSVLCMIEEDKAEQVDFGEVLQAIRFK